MKWMSLVLSYLPLVLQGVVAVERAIAGAPGASKKRVVLDVIQAGAQVSKEIPVEDVRTIGVLVDAVVNSLNESGVFSHAEEVKP